MTAFEELVVAVSAIGLEARSLVAFWDGARGEQPLASVAYNIVHTHNGYGVWMGVGRGELAEGPYEGFRFSDEASACAYVWRSIRSDAAPELLSPDEEKEVAREAEDSVAHQMATYVANGGEDAYPSSREGGDG